MTSSSSLSAATVDGEPRQRLLHVAVRLFAEQGFAKTSVRQIAGQAQVNVASIAYYFGDKEGLYRAAFTEILGDPLQDIERFNDPGATLRQALMGVYAGFFEPLRQGDLAQQATRLHMREMVEPTGLWQQEVQQGILPYNQALVAVLCRHLKLAQPDDDVQRLAFAIVGLGVFLCVGQDVIAAIAPHLTEGEQALNLWAERMTDQALSMVRAEAQRRGIELSA